MRARLAPSPSRYLIRRRQHPRKLSMLKYGDHRLSSESWPRRGSAQDTAAEEAARRAMVIAQLPPDAAKVLFGRQSTPAAGPPQAIGSYERGCLSGAVALLPTGRTGRSC